MGCEQRRRASEGGAEGAGDRGIEGYIRSAVAGCRACRLSRPTLRDDGLRRVCFAASQAAAHAIQPRPTKIGRLEVLSGSHSST